MGLQRLSTQQFDLFREFIYVNSGIRIDHNKVTLLSNRIRRRLDVGGFENFDVYYRFLTSSAGASERDGFFDAITTNETFFFRTPKQFQWLKTDWLAEQVAQNRADQREQQLRIWSAGCANGAEPYSIAICLAENMYRLRDWSLQVVGTDISEQMLQDASAGSFGPRAIEAVTPTQRKRYFQHFADDDRWQVREPIKRLVEFKQHNLMEPMKEQAFDCIFIRNVLIYFDQQSKQAVVKNLLKALVTGGYLVVGPSEGLYGMLNDLQRISPLVYQKVSSTPPPNRAGQSRGIKQ